MCFEIYTDNFAHMAPKTSHLGQIFSYISPFFCLSLDHQQ